jgi:molybdopterin synthase catalytic subunit
MTAVTRPPDDADAWLDLTPDPLSAGAAVDWATLPGCGAVVAFTGTVRDHADGRQGVTRLEYEAYEEQVVPKLRDLAATIRVRWPGVGRIALLHRVGSVALGEPSVVVVVSAPHRAEAFDAARFAIDVLKETVPIWKREFWDGGDDWGLGASEVRAAADRVPTPSDARR